MNLDADVIIAVTTATEQAYLMAVVALRTCKATTTAQVWAFINNSPPSILRTNLVEQCDLLQIKVVEWDKPFSLAKIYNAAFAMTTGKYICYANSDVIFFPKWYGNLIRAWEKEPMYFVLSSFSFDNRIYSCVKHKADLEDGIAEGNPSGALNVFKRSSGYQWDENFTLWEMDADLIHYMQANNLRGGHALSSRVDHLINGVKTQTQGSWEGAIDPSAYLRKKWNLPLQKEQQ